jgi:hypothetical protein
MLEDALLDLTNRDDFVLDQSCRDSARSGISPIIDGAQSTVLIFSGPPID